ncbi:hypothetical protein NDU88_010067 [Pleurodeles waltl]|uniref:Uncharacterized protein n=1 Tax=Pleurodeles waltl TaxID=8319 RepID=A0AAV7PXR7_PLEWA|nr:hypothetical protein NDU88_010067 [Pleurodeles waltl]
MKSLSPAVPCQQSSRPGSAVPHKPPVPNAEKRHPPQGRRSARLTPAKARGRRAAVRSDCRTGPANVRDPPPAQDWGKTGAPMPARIRPVNGALLLPFRQEKCRIYALRPAEPHIVMATLPAG